VFDVSSPAFWSRYFTRFICHHCGSEDGFASRPRNLFESHFLPLLALRPARCGDCYRRSYRPTRVPLLPRREGERASDPGGSSPAGPSKAGSERQHKVA
jgi:hypothetical protein